MRSLLCTLYGINVFTRFRFKLLIYRLKDGYGERLYPWSSFCINCTGKFIHAIFFYT